MKNKFIFKAIEPAKKLISIEYILWGEEYSANFKSIHFKGVQNEEV